MSEPLSSLEAKLDEVFVKKAPWQLPEKAKKWIATYSPWFGLIGGVLGLLAALSLWRAGHEVDNLVNYANQLSKAYGGAVNTTHLGLSFYIALIALVAQSVVSIVAFPGLKARSKAKGWNLLFYAALVNVLYDVFRAVYYSSVSGFIGALIGTVISFYFLFQIRSQYTAK